MNMEEILDLEPLLLWKHFNELSKIPHCSEHEEQVAKYIFETATNLGYNAVVDDVKNVLVKVPASAGYKERGPICLQAHVDMVCEKNSDIPHDFSKDPLDVYVDGDWVTARDTTLGADNGIGVAAMLALLEEQPFPPPPRELLFTVGGGQGVGGGMAGAGENLLKAVTEHFRKLTWSLTPALTKIELARLGNDAGAIGAAGVAWSAFGEK